MSKKSGSMLNPQSGRLWAYWYVCIGLGFLLLGLRSLLAGAPPWTVALRWIIGLGFIILGAGSLYSAKPGSHPRDPDG